MSQWHGASLEHNDATRELIRLCLTQLFRCCFTSSSVGCYDMRSLLCNPTCNVEVRLLGR